MSYFTPKRFLLAIAAALGIVSVGAAQTVPAGYLEVTDYLESFSASSVASSRLNTPKDPWGWNQLNGARQSSGSTYQIDYTATSSGKEGYAIGTTTSAWTRKNWSTNEVFNLYDYIITPEVKGNISFWIKRYSTSDSYKPKLQVYRMHKQADGTFTTDTVADRLDNYDIDLTELLPNTSEWKQQTLNVGSDYCYIGLRMQSLYLDEFTAGKALVPIRKDLSLGNITIVGGTSIKSNQDNTVSVTLTIPVKNSGNTDIKAATAGDGYKISMVRYISSTASDVMATVPLPDLMAGEEKTVEITAESYPIPADITPNSSGEIRFRVDCVEHFTGNETTKTGSWLDITPYTSILDIRYDKKSSYNGSVTDTQVDPGKYINYGSFVGDRTIQFRLRNRGAAPLQITSIEKPDWVTVEGMPEIIQPGADPATIGIKISGEPGLKSGTVKFNTNGSTMVDRISITGEVIGENEFFADFEAADAMSAWYMPDPAARWQVAEYTSNERDNSENYYSLEYGFNGKRLEHTMRPDREEYIYSPKLSFREGEKISFIAAKKTNNGSDIKLVVKYSPDRANWTELGTITVTNDNPDLQFSSGSSSSSTSGGQNVMKHFSFEIPQGEYYIGLGGSYVLVDNFHGGSLVSVDYDIVPETAALGKTQMVNKPLTYNATFKNLTSKEITADSQTVTLFADDQAVASVTPMAIEAGSAVTYSFEYIPHAPGEINLYANIAIGEYSISSSVLTANIQEESALDSTVIGTQNDTSNQIPLAIGYNNSKSEIVYYADQLADLDGTAITQITFPYYKSEENASERLRIWMMNSDDESIPATYADATDVNMMTQVFDQEGYVFEAGGSKDDMIDMVFKFDEPFHYVPGKNLRIVIESLGSTWKSTYFAIDKSDSNHKTFFYRHDTRTTFEEGTATSSTYVGTVVGFPVITISTEKAVPVVSGTVKDEDGNGIAGASVKAVATGSNVYYETETDADGAWCMTLFQPELAYTLTVSAEGYATNSGTPLSIEGDNDITLSEKEEIVPAPVKGDYKAEVNAAKTGYDVTVTWELEPDEDTAIPCDTVEYTFNVHHNGTFHGNTAGLSYTMLDVPQGSHEITVYTKSVSTGKLSEPMVISVQLSDPTGIGVITDESNARYFDMNGLEINPATAAPGLYIKVTPETTVKVLKR